MVSFGAAGLSKAIGGYERSPEVLSPALCLEVTTPATSTVC